MTQPVQEPNLRRTDSSLGFGQRQLQRRPAPVSEAAAAEPMALTYIVTFQTYDIGSANWTQMNHSTVQGGTADWDEGYTNPAAEVVQPGRAVPLFTPDLDRGTIAYATGTNPPGRPVLEISMQAAYFTGAGWAGRVGLMLATDSIVIIPTDGEPYMFQPSPGAAGTYDMYFSYAGIFSGPSAGATPVEFFPKVYQDSGGTLEFFVGTMTIQQIGWFDNSEGTFYP